MNDVFEVSNRQWVRSCAGVIAGVCSGIARKFGVEPWVVRLLWVAAVWAFGTGILLYLILAVCLPREDRIEYSERKRILGVCRRIAARSGMEIGVVRVIAVLLGFASAGTAVIAYVVLHFVFEEDSRGAIRL